MNKANKNAERKQLEHLQFCPYIITVIYVYSCAVDNVDLNLLVQKENNVLQPLIDALRFSNLEKHRTTATISL